MEIDQLALTHFDCVLPVVWTSTLAQSSSDICGSSVRKSMAGVDFSHFPKHSVVKGWRSHTTRNGARPGCPARFEALSIGCLGARAQIIPKGTFCYVKDHEAPCSKSITKDLLT